MKKKTVALLLALVLVVGVAAGGTMAWLLDKTDSITNTFTTSDVNIELAESENLDLQMVPGTTITKDPVVTVKANSEKCYVFVQLAETNWPTATETDGTRKVNYAVATGWTKGDGTNIPANVYYRTVDASNTDQQVHVLANDQVTVSSTLTKTEMQAITTNPTLVITAYACQFSQSNNADFSAADAWTQVSGLNNSGN